MKKILLGVLLTMTLKSFSQAVLYSVSGSTYTQDFQSITSTNLTPATIANTTMFEVSGLSGGGTVSGWYAYHQASGTPRWGRSDGNSNTGSFFGMFDSQSTPNRAFGSQGSSSIIGLIGTVLRNTTGATINTVVITYKAVINRNPSTTVNNYPMSYRVSSTNVVTSSATGDGTFNDGAGTWTNGTGFSTPAAGTGSPNTTQAAISPLFMIGGAPITQTLTGLNWANNQYLYIRWRETDESGADATAGIDDFSITAPVATSTVLVTAQDPNTPTPVNWGIGSTLNQFYWAAITPASFAATLNSVTANMTGNYVAADVATNGLKLYYSSDATFIPAGDVLLSSQSSAKVGATETITWSGLSQNFSSGTTGYIYATADISASANAGNTLAGSFGSNTNIVFSPTVAYNSGNTYGATTNKTFAALPTNPTTFNVNCSSQANIKVNMNAPTVGSVLVFANTGTTFTAPTGAGSGFTGANSNYGSATNYSAVGGRLVYSGAGGNFTVTGLTLGQTYSLIAYSYNGSTWSSGTSVITGTAITQPVTATVVTPGSGQLQLSWTNPAVNACNNNVIVIARQGSAVESAVSKANFDGLVSDVDFTGANATWTLNSNANDVYDLTATLIGTDNTNFLVYKGTGNSVTLNGLTNGTPYFFRIFTVDGNGSAARWSAAVDANGTPDLPGYYWNGGNISTLPANGGTGAWGTANAWRQPGASGVQASWVDGNAAIFAGTAGVVTLDASRSATGYSFTTSNYTLQTTSSTGMNLAGPISIATNQVLVLAPNFPSTTFGVIGVSSINGSGTASVVIFGNPASSVENSRVNLASANSTISVPTEIKSATGIGMAGYVSTSVGGIINGDIINTSSIRTMIGATSGNDLSVNGIISGNQTLQFSAGQSGGAGLIRINNNNTYTGNTIFNAAVSGTIQSGINNALPPATGFTMSASTGNGGSFDLNGFNQTVSSITNIAVNSASITNNSAVNNSTFTINQAANTSFGLRFRNGSGGKTLAVAKQGSGILTLTNNDHDITGGIILSAGELRFNPSASPVALGSCPIVLNGGVLGTSGITASSVLNFSTLDVEGTTTISLAASTHTINFANSSSVAWTSGAGQLDIIGWTGNYTTIPGSSGTNGKIFVGSSASALTSTQLAKIRFYDGSSYYTATLLSTGELVPNGKLTKLETAYCAYTATSATEFIWADSLGTPSTQTNWRYRFRLVNGSNTFTWTTNNEWPIMQFYLISGYSPGTTYTTSVAWSNDNGATFSAYGPTCALTSPITPTTQLSSGSCGSSPATYNTLLYADFVPNATQYQFRLINSSLGYSQTLNKSNSNFILSQFAGLQSNTTYTVQVALNFGSGFGSFGPICTVVTPAAPTTSLSASSCGSSPASYNTLLFSNFVSGAAQYRYRLVNTGLGYSQTFTKSNNNFILSQFTGLQNSTTYVVDVAVNMGSGFGPYGTTCNVTTPGAPTSSLSPAYCGFSPSNYSTLIYAEIVSGATQYEFLVTNAGLGYSQTLLKSNSNFILSQIVGISLSTTYSVQVRAFYNGAWGPFGNVCTLTTPASPIINNGNGNINGMQTAKLLNGQMNETEGNKIDASIFPNPSNETFNIVLTNYFVNQEITLQVYDATGRLIESRKENPENINNMSLGANYAKGIYNVVILQGNSLKNFKVVKE